MNAQLANVINMYGYGLLSNSDQFVRQIVHAFRIDLKETHNANTINGVTR